MATPPLADPNRRPNLGVESPRHANDDLLRDTWLAHLEALRRARLAAADPEAERLRAIVLANERLMCGDGTLGIW